MSSTFIERQDLATALQDPAWSGYFAKKPAMTAQSGELLCIKPGAVIESPLHLSNAAVQVLVLGAGSQVSVFHEYKGEQDTCAQLFIFAEPAAILNYYKLQDQSLQSKHQAQHVIQQEADSLVRCYTISLGARLAQEQITLDLQGEGANGELYGLYLPLAQQCLGNQLQVAHLAANTTSQQLYKAMIDDKSKGVFSGRIQVVEQAQRISASQHNQNLLLSDNAIAQTRPELEIYADDVKCSHGATVGQLDTEALFYLRSRGVPAALARQLLLTAFADQVLDGIKEPSLHQHFHQRVRAKLRYLTEVADDIF